MAPASTIKQVSFPATTPSTLSSELVFRTQARGLEPGLHYWNNSRRVGLGFWGEVGISPEAPGHPCGHSTLQVWEVGTSPGVPGRPWGHSIFQCPHWPQVGHAFVGGCGFGHAFAQCPDLLHRKEGPELGSLKPCSGKTWARLISSLNCCFQKGIFSFSLTFFFYLSFLLLLNTLKATSRKSLWGVVSGPFSSCRSLRLMLGWTG